MPDTSIIIVNFNTVDYLRESLTSVFAHVQGDYEVIVVDNASSDGSVEMVSQEFPQVRLIASAENLGFGVANNLGAQHALGHHVFLFNSDAYLTTDTPAILTAYLRSHPDTSCVCPRVILPGSGQVQPKTFGFTPSLSRLCMQSLGLNRLFPTSAFFRGTDGDDRWAKEMQVGWVSGVCMCIRRQDFLEVGGFDPRFFMYCEDVQLCMKLQKLGNIVLLDDADIVHYGGASSKNLSAKIRNAVLQQRHLLIIMQDTGGKCYRWMATLIMLPGLLMRVLAGILLSPKKGWGKNELLQSSWARLCDVLGICAPQRRV